MPCRTISLSKNAINDTLERSLVAGTIACMIVTAPLPSYNCINWTYHPSWISTRNQCRYNHIPGMTYLTSKMRLPIFETELRLGILPATFVVPRDASAVTRYIRETPLPSTDTSMPRFFFKKTTHRGVRACVDHSEETLQRVQGPMLLQERIVPWLVYDDRRRGFAFDIGVYVVVSALSPFRAYIHRDVLIRTCRHPYPRVAAEFAYPRSFVTTDAYQPIWEALPFRPYMEECARRKTPTALCALRGAIHQQGRNSSAVEHAMHRSISMMLTDALVPILTSSTRRRFIPLDRVFELVRFDFLLNEDSVPRLVEVNHSPSLVGVHPSDVLFKRTMLVDVLRDALSVSAMPAARWMRIA